MSDVVATVKLVLDEADQTEAFMKALQGSIGALDALTKKISPIDDAFEGLVTSADIWNLTLEEALETTNAILRNMLEISGIDPGIRPNIREKAARAGQSGGKRDMAELQAELDAAQARSRDAISNADPEAIVASQREILELQEAITLAKKKSGNEDENLVKVLKEQARIQLAIAKADTGISPAAKRELVSLESQLVNLAENKADSEKQAAAYSEIITKVKRFNLQDEKAMLAVTDKRVASMIRIAQISAQGGDFRTDKLDQEIEAQRSIYRGSSNEKEREAALANIVKLYNQINSLRSQEERDARELIAREKEINALLVARVQIDGGDRKAAVDDLKLREMEYVKLLKSGTLERKDELQVTKDLLAIQRVLAREKNASASPKRNRELDEAKDQGTLSAVQARNVKLQIGGPRSPTSLNSLKALKKTYEDLSAELAGLSQITDVYIEKQKTLDLVTKALASKEAREIGAEMDARASMNREIERSIALSKTQSEAGARARSFLRSQMGVLSQELDQQEKDLIGIRGKLSDINLEETERTALIERENKLISEQLQTSEQLSRVTAAAQPKGTGRRALAAQRRASGADTYGALLDTSRIAQDAPFGLVGIANNLGPALDSYSRLVSQIREATNNTNVLRTATKALARDLLFTPIGWITLLNVITSLVLMAPKIDKWLDRAFGKITATGDAAKDFAEKLKEISAEMSTKGVEFESVEQAEAAFKRLAERVTEAKNARDELGGGSFMSEVASLIPDWLKFFDQSEFDDADDALEGLEAQYEALADQVIRTSLESEAYLNKIQNGAGVAIIRSIEETQDEIRKQFLQTQLASARTGEARVRYTKELFKLETEIQRREIENQLRIQQQKLRSLRRMYVQEMVAREMSREQRGEALDSVRAQREVVQELNALLDNLDNFRAGELQNDLDSLNKKSSKTAEEIAAAMREAIRAIEDVQSEIIGLQIENSNRTFELRRAQLAEEGRLAAQAAARAKQDFADSVKELAGRQGLISQFNREQDRLLTAQAEARQREFAVIEQEQAKFDADQQNRLEDLASYLEELDQRANFFVSDAQVQLSQQALQHRIEVLNVDRQIADIRGKMAEDITQADLDAIQILEEQLFYLDEIQQKERERLRLNIDITKENETQSKRLQLLLAQYEVAAADAVSGDNRYEDAARSADVERDRGLDTVAFEEAERLRNAQLIVNAEDREAEIQLIEADSAYKRYLIWKKYFDDVSNLEYQFFDDRVYEAYRFGLEQIGVVRQTADAMYSNWENSRRAELELQGITGEEQTEMIEREGEKRLKITQTIARAQIVATTALAAVEAYEGALKAFSFLGPAAHGVAALSAGIAIAFGKSQYDAVGKKGISGGGGAGSAYGIGQSLVPGLESNSNPLTGPVTRQDGAIITGRGFSDAGMVSAINSVKSEISNLRTEMGSHVEGIASRPIELGYRDSAAADLVRAGNQYDAARKR